MSKDQEVLFSDRAEEKKEHPFFDNKKIEEPSLFDVKEDWEIEWRGMPEFISDNFKPSQKITVSFKNFDDVREFARRIGIQVTKKTNSCWFPPRKRDSGDVYISDKWDVDEK